MNNSHKVNPWIEAVIFDFDGTLAELHIDFAQMRAAIADLLHLYNLLPRDFDHLYILEMIEEAGRRISESSSEKGENFKKDAMALVENMEVNAAARSGLFEGVTEMLSDIRNKSIATGVITRNCRRSVQTVFPDYGQYVDALISREMTLHVKPDPRHLLEILSLLNIDADRTLMVGDHPIDIQIGKELGTYTAAVLTGTGKLDDLTHARPDFLLQNVLEIRDILLTVNQAKFSHLNSLL
jgi:phosphoglycolate phosphatase